MKTSEICEGLRKAGFEVKSSRDPYIEYPCIDYTKHAIVKIIKHDMKSVLTACYWSEGRNILSTLWEEVDKTNLKEKCEKFKKDVDKIVKQSYGYKHQRE